MKNAHSAGSGRPLVLRTEEGYISYFENDREEQWGFSMDWEFEVFFLAGGQHWLERTYNRRTRVARLGTWSP